MNVKRFAVTLVALTASTVTAFTQNADAQVLNIKYFNEKPIHYISSASIQNNGINDNTDIQTYTPPDLMTLKVYSDITRDLPAVIFNFSDDVGVFVYISEHSIPKEPIDSEGDTLILHIDS